MSEQVKNQHPQYVGGLGSTVKFRLPGETKTQGTRLGVITEWNDPVTINEQPREIGGKPQVRQVPCSCIVDFVKKDIAGNEITSKGMA